MKLDILAIGVHPDDVELSCAGTLLRHIDNGYKVGILDLTQGEMGTRGSAKIRLEEAENSRKLMGAIIRENLGIADGFFEHNKENILKISKVIRTYRPDVILANAVADRHPDHGRAAKLVSDTCFYSGLKKVVQVNDDGDDLLPWRPKVLYHYVQDRDIKSDFVVDISDYIDKKIECIMSFKSQFFDPNSKEPKTPISGEDFLQFIRSKNQTYGREINVDFAEAFTIDRKIGVKNLFDLI
ncbi:MAG: bacillithiol biosynthesis deacetylase BshB1 [Saprospiraceae bacterium]